MGIVLPTATSFGRPVKLEVEAKRDGCAMSDMSKIRHVAYGKSLKLARTKLVWLELMSNFLSPVVARKTLENRHN